MTESSIRSSMVAKSTFPSFSWAEQNRGEVTLLLSGEAGLLPLEGGAAATRARASTRSLHCRAVLHGPRSSRLHTACASFWGVSGAACALPPAAAPARVAALPPTPTAESQALLHGARLAKGTRLAWLADPAQTAKASALPQQDGGGGRQERGQKPLAPCQGQSSVAPPPAQPSATCSPAAAGPGGRPTAPSPACLGRPRTPAGLRPGPPPGGPPAGQAGRGQGGVRAENAPSQSCFRSAVGWAQAEKAKPWKQASCCTARAPVPPAQPRLPCPRGGPRHIPCRGGGKRGEVPGPTMLSTPHLGSGHCQGHMVGLHGDSSGRLLSNGDWELHGGSGEVAPQHLHGEGATAVRPTQEQGHPCHRGRSPHTPGSPKDGSAAGEPPKPRPLQCHPRRHPWNCGGGLLHVPPSPKSSTLAPEAPPPSQCQLLRPAQRESSAGEAKRAPAFLPAPAAPSPSAPRAQSPRPCCSSSPCCGLTGLRSSHG